MANNNPWYFLDPDNNRKDPEVGLFCCRCKHTLENAKSFVRVERHSEHPWVRQSESGNLLMGNGCWNKIVKSGEVN